MPNSADKEKCRLGRFKSELSPKFAQKRMEPTPFMGIDPNILTDLVTARMPFGKYKGSILADLPEPYLVWFQQKGFPPGKLGMQLNTLYEIKLNGLEYLLRPLRR